MNAFSEFFKTTVECYYEAKDSAAQAPTDTLKANATKVMNNMQELFPLVFGLEPDIEKYIKREENVGSFTFTCTDELKRIPRIEVIS